MIWLAFNTRLVRYFGSDWVSLVSTIYLKSKIFYIKCLLTIRIMQKMSLDSSFRMQVLEEE